jgi:hypothetical protein
VRIDYLPTEKIGTWCVYNEEYFSTSNYFEESLETFIKREGWNNVPPVPVFELPEGFPHQYVLIDGHTRHGIARRMNQKLKCAVYQKDEPIDITRDGLSDFGIINEGIKKDYYSSVLRLYTESNKLGIKPKLI